MTTKSNANSGGSSSGSNKDAHAAKVDALIKGVLSMSRKTIYSPRRPGGYFPEIRSKVTKLTPS